MSNAEIVLATKCVLTGNKRAIVKSLNTLGANVQGLVEGVNKVCYAIFIFFFFVSGLIGKYCVW